jgi:putative isomerase
VSRTDAASCYQDLLSSLLRGWNTWNTRSMLSHVLLPHGFSLNVAVKEYREGGYLKEALIGRHEQGAERVRAGLRSWDGAYTDLRVSWRGIELHVESALADGDLVMRLSGAHDHRRPPLVVLEGGVLWNRPGSVRRDDALLRGSFPMGEIPVHVSRPSVEEPGIPHAGPYLCFPLGPAVHVSTGRPRTTGQVDAAIAAGRAAQERQAERFGDLREVFEAVRTVGAWNTIYDPSKGRLFTTVSRLWNIGYGGYVVFDWDSYFAALLAGIDNRDVAYANAIAITRELTPRGFVPNVSAANGYVSLDRSEPPVGSLVVRLLYERYRERWLLEEVYDGLLAWNRWWHAERSHRGYLCWGSTPFTPAVDHHWERVGVGERFGAALESGMDNSPLYDDVPFNTERHVLELGDAGLMGMYVMDCDNLVLIARALGREDDAVEIGGRGDLYRARLREMWDRDAGMFLNVRTDTGERSPRLAPTNFFPLLARAASPEQAAEMVARHLRNPAEFWGEWVMPSISRADSAYKDQDYWRGRIWAPHNFLVYLGLKGCGQDTAAADLEARSRALLLKGWRQSGLVCENYNADSGTGHDRPNSDGFYIWGALLGLIGIMEKGLYRA